ncbi:MAG: Asp-tRNA(Asn)/Glu-tRNA(Gln) amidotransferase subunit GatA, partial [Lentisphaeria bacterium]|nr:Asp-tRNA(Asn)/Glu-tRNA(Gln) amidotransferase subunit GatA [Lentisphaeria bacterium]
MEKNLSSRTLAELASGLKAGEFSSADIVRSALDAVKTRDTEVKAFLGVTPELALREAEAADAHRAKGELRSEWDGIPVGIKDNIAVKGEKLSCASKLLAPVVSPYDATAIVNLRKFGFIPFGRLNMDEFAMGSSCENSAFQKTANPRAVSRVPGGSSGGSAAAVAA